MALTQAACRAIHAGAPRRKARTMKTCIPRDVATARRPGRPISAAMSTACWAQAETDRARIGTVFGALPYWGGAPRRRARPHRPQSTAPPAEPIAGRANLCASAATGSIRPSREPESCTDDPETRHLGLPHLAALPRSRPSVARRRSYPELDLGARARTTIFAGRTCGSERPSLAPVPRLPGPIQRSSRWAPSTIRWSTRRTAWPPG